MPKRDLYYKMMKLIEQEEEVTKRVRKAEDEVKLIFFVLKFNRCLFVFFKDTGPSNSSTTRRTFK